MSKKVPVEVRALTAAVEEGNLIVRVKIFNPEYRTLHAYRSPRRILYENATGKLTLYFHDQRVEEDSASLRHLPEPTFVSLEGNAEAEIKISLPKVMNRIKS